MYNSGRNSDKSLKTCLDCILMSPLFKLLTEKELEIIDDNRFEVNFRSGENIRKQGTYLSHAISLNAGLAKLYLEGINNRNIILRIIKPTSFIGELSTNTLSTYNRLINLTQKQMPGRMADVLIYLAEEIFENRKFEMFLSRNDMAELSGMSKDNVGRVLNSFKSEGLIEISDNVIEILNIDSLQVVSRIG